MFTTPVLDHGFVTLRNVSGPTRRQEQLFDADDTDPANSARMSFDQSDKDRTRDDDLKLAGYLMKNLHTTPIEMIEVWLEMKLPLFVARQFVRHRTVSINEVSARYIQLPKEFYIPDEDVVGVKGANIKQGRVISKDMTDDQRESVRWFLDNLEESCDSAYWNYEEAIKSGIPSELARCFLPVNIYTHWLWKQDLHNMMHFLSLRMHEHAQFEAQAYAKAIVELLREVLPHQIELFEEHRVR